MLTNVKTNSRNWLAVISLLLVVLAVVVFLLFGPSGVLSRATAPSVPVTGGSAAGEATMGMSARSMEAYSARLSGIAGQSMGMSARSMQSYSARLSGASGQSAGMSARAIHAYSERMSRAAGGAVSMSQRAREAYSARLAGQAKNYLAMTGK